MNEKDQPATQSDIHVLRSEMRADIREACNQMRDEILDVIHDLIDRFDEHARDTKESFKRLEKKVDNHGLRLNAVETDVALVKKLIAR